ncbi:hypothetical protein [Actinocrispum wychmicini]|uniref:Uncharacterized protein n=1 Tax=Actinocrispum wychmicini TaxID=1213861 RepID=A0A4R2J3B2_9PSEU|nr:hypothetical protein [Actinocrispum wychmicini]TCO52961.1 hypothetical protein EV192_111155 [Actinocrispum wychmicini]
MSGYRTDPAELAELARRLAQATEDIQAASAVLAEGAAGDLGPGGVTEVVDELTRMCAAKIDGVHGELAAAEQRVRATRDAYTGVESRVAGSFDAG